MKKSIILASASRRRSAILRSCGIKHKVVVSGTPEAFEGRDDITRTVLRNAKNKALAVAPRYKKAVIIGADTLVCMGKRLIGKPKDLKHARELLIRFGGKKIDIYTGIFVIDTATGKKAAGYETSSVFAKKLSGRDINRYFKILAPYDKAGGFSIEGVGSILFDNITGSYFNILGLPMTKLAELFRKSGLDILDFIEREQIT